MIEDGVTEQDLVFLRRAIELARDARADGRHPFGSLVVNGRGEIVVEALNNAVRPKGDPTQHAETVACAQAAKLPAERFTRARSHAPWVPERFTGQASVELFSP